MRFDFGQTFPSRDLERDIRRITGGLEARVEVDAYPGETFTGRVANMSPVLDPATRTASIEIEIPNPGFRLKPGMYATITLTSELAPDAVLVQVGGEVLREMVLGKGKGADGSGMEHFFSAHLETVVAAYLEALAQPTGE